MPAGDFENGILPVQHLEQAIQDDAIAADQRIRVDSAPPRARPMAKCYMHVRTSTKHSNRSIIARKY